MCSWNVLMYGMCILDFRCSSYDILSEWVIYRLFFLQYLISTCLTYWKCAQLFFVFCVYAKWMSQVNGASQCDVASCSWNFVISWLLLSSVLVLFWIERWKQHTIIVVSALQHTEKIANIDECWKWKYICLLFLFKNKLYHFRMSMKAKRSRINRWKSFEKRMAMWGERWDSFNIWTKKEITAHELGRQFTHRPN